MLTFLLVTAITAVLVGVVYTRVYKAARKPSAPTPVDYNVHVTEAQKIDAIMRARSGKVLRDMWGQWRERGWQDGGAMHARVLLEVQSWGESLTSEEKAHLALYQVRALEGAQKPKIRGRMR